MTDEKNANVYGASLPFIKVEGNTAFYGNDSDPCFTIGGRPVEGGYLQIDKYVHEILGEPNAIVVEIQRADTWAEKVRANADAREVTSST